MQDFLRSVSGNGVLQQRFVKSIYQVTTSSILRAFHNYHQLTFKIILSFRWPKMWSFLHIAVVLAGVGYVSAGQGANFYMINLSGSDLQRTGFGTYQMNSFAFPELLKNGETASVYIEFGQSIFHNTGDDSGWIDYELVGTGGKKFQITTHANGFRIELCYTNLEFDGSPIGRKHNLGWNHDGDNIFVIVNNNGYYSGTGLDGSNWMKNNIGWLGPRRLIDISVPGTHDSGMSTINGNTAFGDRCEVITQHFNIQDQLNLGARYFDIRPVIGNGGEYLTGHYGHIPGSYQGANGESIDSIIRGINNFTSQHNELIIINLSHTYNTDVGADSYRKFTQAEWDTLFSKLDNINFRYYNSKNNVDLGGVTLDEFTNNGSKAAVVFIVDESGVQLGSRLGQGYFFLSNLNTYDSYANTDQLSKMESDQINKMKTFSRTNYFLLSWTLTMQSICNPFSKTGSVEGLAHEARAHTGRAIYPEVSDSAFPNVISTDFLEDTDIAALALAFNTKVHF